MTTAVAPEPFMSQIESLPPVAAVAERVTRLSTSPNASAADIARALSADPAIAAKVLRIANSPFYGSSREITQISRAVVLLGSVAVRNLVTSICARNALGSSTGRDPEYEVLWRHSAAVAVAGDLIARSAGYRPPEEAFLAGLLHDIGQLAMVAFHPDAFRAVFRDQGKGIRFLALERNHLGMDHVEAGHRILSRWGLPEILCLVVRDHHLQEIPATEHHAQLLAIVMLADTFAHMMGMGLDVPTGTSRRAQAAAEYLKLTDSDQLQIIERLGPRLDIALEMLSGDSAPAMDTGRRSSTCAFWVSPTPPPRLNVGQLLLEHRGYELQNVTEETLPTSARPDDLIVLDFPNADAATVQAVGESLVAEGFTKVVFLSDLMEGMPLREFDPRTGLCRVPRLFTAFDLQWAEGIWRTSCPRSS